MSQARRFRNALLATALTLAASTALAAGSGPVVARMDGVMLLAGQPVGPAVKAAVQPPGRVGIFDNFFPPKKYPNGTYFCCIGPGIDGPSNSYGSPAQSWAEAFTPSANATVTRIDVGVGYATGTNSVNIGLYTDSNGSPGTPLVAKDVKNLPKFGSCCATIALKAGIQVTAGTQYWVVLTTDATDPTFAGGWNEDTRDQVTKINQAENIGNGWQPGPIAPGVALAVWGK